MASKKKKKLGSLGPAAHWLDMSLLQRERTKQYIKESFNGYTRADGVEIPSVRRIYRGLSASDGYDLRHIERWTAAKLKTARDRIQSFNTLSGRPFRIVTPHTKKQRKFAQTFTGQNLPYQKSFVVQVQDSKHDRAVFRDNKVSIERTFKGGSKTIKQRYLFKDYLRPDETLAEELEEEDMDDDVLDSPTSFLEMREVTKRMLLDMPKKQYGRDVYYTIITVQYGPIGESVLHEDVLDHLTYYHNTYDLGNQHAHFAEQVIGFQMVGTYVSAAAFQKQRDADKANRKRLKKLRFQKPAPDNRCHVTLASTGQRCVKKAHHKGKHKFK